jgi:uncharacterized protein (TIGR02687 family)
MTKISMALNRLFEKHRIVFWYDHKRELRAEYEVLAIPDVEKIELKNNEFNIKHRILRQEPSRKFLLFHDGPQPPDLENWLLDVLLANGEFRADQISLWLSDLGLGPEFWDVVQEHEEFFQSQSRRDALRALLKPQDTHTMLRMKMLSVCANSNVELRLDDLLEILLDELASGQDNCYALFRRCALEDFFWDRVKRTFGYQSEKPGVRDFAIELFKSCYAMTLGGQASLNSEALVFIKRWKDSRQHHVAFEKLSEECTEILNIEADLHHRDISALVDMDDFRLIDQKILSDLAQQVLNRTITAAACSQWVWRRRTTHWFEEFRHIYEAINIAAWYLAELDQADLTIQSISDGVYKYIRTWHRLDQFYRKFIYNARTSRQVSLLQNLMERIENLYSNNYLRTLNDRWQQMIDASLTWDLAPLPAQNEFFTNFVDGFIRDQHKVGVIISDGLRYEIASELLTKIQSEDRYTANLEAIFAMLPSYTQLGMAALLPNTSILLQDDASVLVDGQSTMGTENRAKILSKVVPGGAAALRAEDLLAMSREESRALFRDHQVIYVFHNQIDAVGDKRDTEERVFDAVEQSLNEIIDLIKKLANANLTNFLVTTDHGFIYQHRTIDESDFASLDVNGENITYKHRRFVLGHGLQPNPGIKHFRVADLGLVGDLEVAIPKSINRLRLQGSGSRYVHGGATLQEVILPVIRINKKRESDIQQVEVDILRSPSSIISTGQLAVAFFQSQPVSAKIQTRKLRAGIYTQSGELISDQHDLIFDLTSENPREREVKARFVLSRKAEQANEQEVILKLEELVPNTAHYREYKSARYLLRRSFTSDFDF